MLRLNTEHKWAGTIYDENGYRTRKTVGSTVYTYIWDGERLVSQDTGTAGSEIVFLYDASGNMFGFRRSGKSAIDYYFFLLVIAVKS